MLVSCKCMESRSKPSSVNPAPLTFTRFTTHTVYFKILRRNMFFTNYFQSSITFYTSKYLRRSWTRKIVPLHLLSVTCNIRTLCRMIHCVTIGCDIARSSTRSELTAQRQSFCVFGDEWFVQSTYLRQ